MATVSEKLVYLPANPDPITFAEACNFLFKRDLPDWLNGSSNMNGCMIPKSFRYKNEQVVCEEHKDIRKDRIGEYPEHVLFRAFNLMLYDSNYKDLSKMIVIRQFRFDLGRKKRLRLLYPNIDWFSLADFDTDFLIIHRDLGIFVIEVKGTERTTKDLEHAVKQLENVQNLFQFLVSKETNIVNIESTFFPINKIIFAPNFSLELSLDNVDFNDIKAFIKTDFKMFGFEGDLYGSSEKGVEQRTIEDASHCVMLWLTNLLQSSKKKWSPNEACEFAKALIGIDLLAQVSPTVGAKKQKLKTTLSVSADNKTLSFASSILDDGSTVQNQNYNSITQRLKGAVSSLQSTADLGLSISNSNLWKLVMLSLDQQTILKGPNYQFIFGVAGTGKTVLICAKILEITKNKNENIGIIVVTSHSFKLNYTQFVQANSLTNYVTVVTHDEIRDIYCEIFTVESFSKLTDLILEKYNTFCFSDTWCNDSSKNPLLQLFPENDKFTRSFILFLPHLRDIILPYLINAYEIFVNKHILIDDAIVTVEMQDNEADSTLSDVSLGMWPLLLLNEPLKNKNCFWYAADLWQVMKMIHRHYLAEDSQNESECLSERMKSFLNSCFDGVFQTTFVSLLLTHIMLNTASSNLGTIHQVMRCPNEVFSVVESFLKSQIKKWKTSPILNSLFPFVKSMNNLCTIGHKFSGILRNVINLKISGSEPKVSIIESILSSIPVLSNPQLSKTLLPYAALIYSIVTDEGKGVESHPLSSPVLWQNVVKNWLQKQNPAGNIIVESAGQSHNNNLQNVFVIDHVGGVVSHEWNVIIFVAISTGSLHPLGWHPSHYIAISRCTSHLVVVNVNFS